MKASLAFRSAIAMLVTGSALSASAEPSVLVVLSAAREIPLREGGSHPTGVFLGELTEPVEAMLKAGFSLTFASPGGHAPMVDLLHDNFLVSDAPNLAAAFVKTVLARESAVN